MKTKLVLNLILLGDPGAGKATQSAYLAKKYKMFDFDMGRELALLREKNQKVNATLKKNYDKGILAPSAMVKIILREKIKNLPKNKSIIFDGHPKMISEARLVAQMFKKSNRTKPLVLYLTLPTVESHRRTLKRKGYLNTKTTKRLDDSIQALKNRAKYYRINIKQVAEFFASHYTFAKINATGTREEVRKRIQKAIDFYIKNYEQIYQNRGRN